MIARRKAEEERRKAELKARREADERKKAAWQKLCSDSPCSEKYICSLSKEDQEAIKMAVASWTISKEEWERRGERFHTQNKNSFADRRMRALEKKSS